MTPPVAVRPMHRCHHQQGIGIASGGGPLGQFSLAKHVIGNPGPSGLLDEAAVVRRYYVVSLPLT